MGSPNIATMVSAVHLRNYRSFGSRTSLALGSLTVLAGRNGAGKSTVLDALDFIGDVCRENLEVALSRRGGLQAVLHSGAGDMTLGYELSLPSGFLQESARARYEIIVESVGEQEYRVQREHAWLHVEGEGPLSFEVKEGKLAGIGGLDGFDVPRGQIFLPLAADFKRLYDHLRGIVSYSLAFDALRRSQEPSSSPLMDAKGEQWCAALKKLGDSELKLLGAVLAKLSGNAVDGARAATIYGHLVPQFHHVADDTWRDANRESDGTLRMAAITTALYQTPRPALVAIEEPELAVHPGVLPLIYDLLHGASTLSQVVVTSHSPDLLELLEPEQILVIDHDGHQSTVGPLALHQMTAVRKRLMTLGELVRVEGLQQQMEA